MHLFFIDESGTAAPQGKNHTKYFIIGGVVIPEIHWHEIDKKLNKLKDDYKITSEIKWRYFTPQNNDETNGLKHLTLAQKNDVRNKLYDIITAHKSIKIISTIIDVDKAYQQNYIKDQNELYWQGYYQVLNRFQDYLHEISIESGGYFNGLVVIDNRLKCDDDKLRNLHNTMLTINKTLELSQNHLIEGLFIAPSHLSTGIQFADIVAGAIFRKYEKSEETYFNKIKQSIITTNGIIELPK